MSQPWSATAGPAASSVATLLIAAASGGQVRRLMAFSASIAGTTSASTVFQVLDGSSGTTLFQLGLGIPAAGGVASLIVSNVDYRASPSNALVVGFTSGISTITQAVNANGDLIQAGAPAFIFPTS